MSEARRTLHVNGVEICLQTSGDPAHPTLLLIGGAGTTIELWPEPLVEWRVAGGRHVVRYAHRDTGISLGGGAASSSP